MLRVLTLSTLFPNSAEPTLGVFVERQTLGLARRPDVELEVVSPVGLPIWPLSQHPHYRARSRLPREEQWKGLKVHRPRFPVIPRVGEYRSATAMARSLLPLLKRIRERFRFDVIDAEFFWPDGPAAMLLSSELGVPFSVKARGGDIHYWGARDGIGGQIIEAARAAGGLLAVSAALKRDMAAVGILKDKILVHYTGIDLDRFKPIDREAAKRELGVDGPLIITAGALIPRKSQQLVLEALAQLPDTTLMLVGEGPDRKDLERSAAALAIAERVRFLGSRSHEEVPRLLGAADAMVLPSKSEGLANVWLEALACGTPIVISDVGGACELLDRPEAGRLVRREPGPIAEALREIFASPPSQEAVRGAAKRFSWEKNSEELFAHLSRVARR